MDPAVRANNGADNLASAHAYLVAAIESLVSGDDWQRMLEVASRFHHYSANNVLLIMLQRPDATRVAGYRAWLSMGRQVRKGERGIRILAPCRHRHQEPENDGTENSSVRVRGFTTVTVFDISQTDGKDLPHVRPMLLDGDDTTDLWGALSVQVAAAGYTVARGDCNGANGLTDHRERTVRVRDDVSGAQAVKTLCHELAHVLLHPDTTTYFQCRGVSEVEAESVAYLVCQAAGLATDNYSWPYIAHWSDGKSEVVHGTTGRVLESTRAILVGMSMCPAVPMEVFLESRQNPWE
jgi:hypothetical protein